MYVEEEGWYEDEEEFPWWEEADGFYYPDEEYPLPNEEFSPYLGTASAADY